MIEPINAEWLLSLSPDKFKMLRSRIEDLFASTTIGVTHEVYDAGELLIEELKAFHADSYIKAENAKVVDGS